VTSRCWRLCPCVTAAAPVGAAGNRRRACSAHNLTKPFEPRFLQLNRPYPEVLAVQ